VPRDREGLCLTLRRTPTTAKSSRSAGALRFGLPMKLRAVITRVKQLGVEEDHCAKVVAAESIHGTRDRDWAPGDAGPRHRDERGSSATTASETRSRLLSPRRTLLSVGKAAPELGAVEPPEKGEVIEVPVVGGLHHRYERWAA
jgi:hypothetical protein